MVYDARGDEEVMSVRSSIFSYADSHRGEQKGGIDVAICFLSAPPKTPPPQKAFLLIVHKIQENNEH